MPCPPLSPNYHYILHDGPDVQVTTSTPMQSRSESSVVVNPTNPQNLICASKKFIAPHLYHGTISTSHSTDGGVTWAESEPAREEGWDGMTDPDLTFDAAGNAYLIVEPLSYAAGINTIGMYVYKSTDGGQTWNAPVQLHLDYADDKQWIEADTSPASPYFGAVYAVWGAGTPLRFARSLDQGATWQGAGGSPSGSDVTADRIYAPSLAVGEDGTLHVTWHIPRSTEILYTRSTDGGNTWSAPTTVVTGITSLHSVLPNTGGFPHFDNGIFRVMTLVTSSAAAGNRLIIAWADRRDGVSRIYYRVASGGGTTWLGPSNGQPLLAFASDPAHEHFHPQLSQAGNQAIGLAFYDYGPTKEQELRIDVRLAFSCSDGTLFSVPMTVTDRPWDPAVNAPWSHGLSTITFIGEYFGLAGAPSAFAVVWTDTRTGVQELFYDNVSLKGELVYPLARVTPNIEEILAGVVQDGGGLVYVGGKVIRIPPWDPSIDVLHALAAIDAVKNIRNPEARHALAALQNVIASVAHQQLKAGAESHE